MIIEAGSGSGRFTEVALAHAVRSSCPRLQPRRGCELCIQWRQRKTPARSGDLFHMPFPKGVADRLFCFGVLQHTPDPRRGFEGLAEYVRPGGAVVADIYAKTLVRYVLATKYWASPRHATYATRPAVPTDAARYVDFMWPLARKIRQIPRLGRSLNWRLLIGDYSDFDCGRRRPPRLGMTRHLRHALAPLRQACQLQDGQAVVFGSGPRLYRGAAKARLCDSRPAPLARLGRDVHAAPEPGQALLVTLSLVFVESQP